MDHRPPVPWYRRWWVLLGAVCVLLVACLWGVKAYREWEVDRALAEVIAVLDQQDPNWRYEQWQNRQPDLKLEQNLALVATQLKTRIVNYPANYEKLLSEIDCYPANVLNPEQINAYKIMMTDCTGLPAEIERMLKIKTGVFPLPEHRDYRFRIMATQLNRQQELRGVANILNYYAQFHIQEKHPAEALTACEAILHLAHACDHDPFFITHLIRIAVQGSAVPTIERVLAQTEPTEASLIHMQERLLAEANTSFCKPGIQGDRASLERYLREVEEGRYTSKELTNFMNRKPPWRGNYSIDQFLQDARTWLGGTPYGYVPQERLKLLRFYNSSLELLERGASLNEMKELAERARQDSLAVSLFGAAISKVYEADLKRSISLRLAAALMAAERYRRATGKIASGWNDLVPKYYPSIPVDPFNSQPARWKATPTGFVVYSVWMNEKDDGGNVRQTPEGVSPLDTGVEYFAPTYRRQAARPVVNEDYAGPLDEKEQFFAAARSGNVASLEALLKSGINVNTKTEYGATALCFAAEKGHLEVMKFLIEKKIDLEAKDTFYGADAITWASMADQHQAVTLLLKSGAKGETALLSAAIQQNQPKMVSAILASGRVSQELLDKSLNSIDAKKTEIIKLLTGAGAKGKPKEVASNEKKSETPAKAETTPAKTDEAQLTSAPVVEPAERVKQRQPWPGFRGIGNAGVADGQYPPTSWDATTGKNLIWKTPVPGLGLSCPIVWGNRLFVTTAINMESPKPSLRIGQYGDVDSVKEEVLHNWKIYCLDTQTGKVLWERVTCVGVPKTKRHMKSSHANATPVTDGTHVVVNFGSEGIFCYTVDGQYLWKREFGKLGSTWFFNPEYEWGFGSSPVIYGDTVIVQCDIGKSSFIAAYLLSDGSQIWSTPREEIPSWCSPTLVEPEKGQPELVTVASKYARGYDPLTGTERWRLGRFSEIAVPTPFYAEGLIYLTTGYRPIQPIYAIKPGSMGDLTLPAGKESSESVVWSKTRGGPYLPTPIVYQGYLYVCNNAGVFSCYEAKTGKTVYQKRLGGKNGYTASLVAADGRIYCTDEEGVVRVVKAGPEFQLLAINKLGEECLSHPAISDGRIFFRAREHVFAFGLNAVKQ